MRVTHSKFGTGEAFPETGDTLLHTSALLRKHQLLEEQTGWGKDATYRLVDWQTYRVVSKARAAAYLKEEKGEN